MKKLILAILVIFLIIPIVNAQTSTITIEDPVYDSTTVDVGTTRTVSVTLKSSSGSVTSSVSMVTATESGTGTLTAYTDTGKSQYESVSITSTGVTKTFTVSASASGTYSFYVKSTDSEGNGAQSSVGYLEYVNPSSFTMTVDDNATGTYSSGTSVGLVVTFHNHLSTPQTRNITLWFQHSPTATSGDPLSRLVTLQGGESSQLIWNFTPTYASPSEAYVRLGDNQQAATFTFSQPSADGGDGTTGGGGGGGGGGGAAANVTHKKIQIWTKITPGAATIMKITDPVIGLKQINITVKNQANNVKITVTKLDGKPATIVHEIVGKVYKYIEINAENINKTHLDKVKIKFEVNKSWINDNNIDPDTVALYRYTNVWEKLLTTKTSEDNDFVYYEAETPGFSTFAISGEVEAEATTTVPGETTTVITTTTVPVTVAEMEVPPWAIIVVIIIVIAVIGFWLYKRK